MATLDFLHARIEAVPKIIKAYNQDDLGDDPASHRWRAHWYTDDGTVTGIELTAYPVVSLTRVGAWIGTSSWRETDREGRHWNIGPSKRWVSNDGAQAWAKPTQEAALYSIAVRLTRWAQNVYYDAKRARSAAEVLKALRPDDADFAARALESLDAIRSE